MNAPVDLTDLRSMIDGDVEMELALFEEFYLSTEENLQLLASHCTEGENETWRATAHSIKGTAYNIGAHHFGHLCEEAQHMAIASAAQRQAQLDALLAEYKTVKAYLKAIPR